jgi:hypothetical protein
MNYTLDTAAIRRRFEQAIIGIRQDGTMAVLVPSGNGIYFDLVSGYRMNDDNCYRDFSQFPTLIRPGDRCEFSYVGRENLWDAGTYQGVRMSEYMFQSDLQVGGGRAVYSLIRPLPAAETEAEVEPETTLLDEIRSAINRNSAENDSDTPDFILARFLTECLNAWNKTVAEREKWYNRSCGGSKSITDNFHPNQPLSRLTAAEQELAAIRAEMKQVQK